MRRKFLNNFHAIICLYMLIELSASYVKKPLQLADYVSLTHCCLILLGLFTQHYLVLDLIAFLQGLLIPLVFVYLGHDYWSSMATTLLMSISFCASMGSLKLAVIQLAFHSVTLSYYIRPKLEADLTTLSHQEVVELTLEFFFSITRAAVLGFILTL